MRAFFAAVGRILAAIPLMIWKRVLEAGEWVSRLVSAGPADAPPQVPPPPAESLDVLRQAAGVLAQGRDLEAKHLVGLSETRVHWLRALDRRQLCTLMSRSDTDLRRHFRGEIRLPGLPPADRTTVAALVEARKPKPTAKGYRTLRDRLAELEAADTDETAPAWTPAL